MRSTRGAGHGTRLKGEAILFNYGSQGKSQVQLDGGEKHEREAWVNFLTFLRKSVYNTQEILYKYL